MKHARTVRLSDFSERKRNVLISAVVFSALLGPFRLISFYIDSPRFITNFVSLFGLSVLILAWCYYDSLERGKVLRSRFRLLIVIFGPLALFIYLFKSRGFSQGIVSTGVALLVYVGLLLVMIVSALLVAVVFVP